MNIEPPSTKHLILFTFLNQIEQFCDIRSTRYRATTFLWSSEVKRNVWVFNLLWLLKCSFTGLSTPNQKKKSWVHEIRICSRLVRIYPWWNLKGSPKKSQRPLVAPQCCNNNLFFPKIHTIFWKFFYLMSPVSSLLGLF